MIQLKYYSVESGWNCCLIRQKKVALSLRRMMKRGAQDYASFILGLYWKRIKKLFKKNIHFKVVYVDKMHLIWMESHVIDKVSDGKIEPEISNDMYDIYVMEPEQSLELKYSVYEHQIENRSIRYKDLVDPYKE